MSSPCYETLPNLGRIGTALTTIGTFARHEASLPTPGIFTTAILYTSHESRFLPSCTVKRRIRFTRTTDYLPPKEGLLIECCPRLGHETRAESSNNQSSVSGSISISSCDGPAEKRPRFTSIRRGGRFPTSPVSHALVNVSR
jgi:hypothetical protein